MLPELPRDVVSLIFAWVAVQTRAQRIQAVFRAHRTRVLLGRFRMLRYLHEFRQWNPSAAQFLARARI
jgi:hypothetical protein